MQELSVKYGSPDPIYKSRREQTRPLVLYLCLPLATHQSGSDMQVLRANYQEKSERLCLPSSHCRDWRRYWTGQKAWVKLVCSDEGDLGWFSHLLWMEKGGDENSLNYGGERPHSRLQGAWPARCV
jgi:hypothetical protein